MDFILIGCDPSAEAFVQAARARGHRLIAFWDVNPSKGKRDFPGATAIHSAEQIAGFGRVDFLILSGDVDGRAERLRHFLRSVPIDLAISVPLDEKPDVYYELGLWQKENNVKVTALIAETAHPAFRRFMAECPTQETGSKPVGIEATLPLVGADEGCWRYSQGWNWLRALGGEIDGITTIASAADPLAAEEIVASVRYADGRLASVRFLRSEPDGARFRVRQGDDEWRCDLPEGFGGPALLSSTKGGERTEDNLPAPAIADRWIQAMETPGTDREWLIAATRQIELAAATYRSLKYQRAVSLEYDEFSEEASFKGIMTAAGCALLWAIVLALILSAMGVPFIHYLILPALLIFLALQALSLVFRRSNAAKDG